MPLPDSTPLQDQLADYLLTKLDAEDGSTFIKSKHIANDLEASTKEIGVTMAALESDQTTPFNMTRHGGSSDGTTWRVERDA